MQGLPITLDPARLWERLTPAEQLVSAGIVRGMSNKAIASELAISRRTVEAHVTHIFAKLEVGSRLQICLAMWTPRRTAQMAC